VDPNPAQTQSLIAAVRAAHPPRPPTVYEQYASILARHQAYMPGHHQSNPNNAMVGGGRGPVGLPFSTLMPSSSPHHHHHHGPGGAQHPQPMVVVINATPGMEGQGAGAPGTASWGAAVAAAALGAARQGGHQLQTVTLPAPAGASGGGLAHAGASATGEGRGWGCCQQGPYSTVLAYILLQTPSRRAYATGEGRGWVGWSDGGQQGVHYMASCVFPKVQVLGRLPLLMLLGQNICRSGMKAGDWLC
jgi:hypothetical protein